MAVTMAQVLTELTRDEPDYTAAAALGKEALPHLLQILDGDDGMLASKAAYLAGLIGGPEAAGAIDAAASHTDPVVRVALAHSLGPQRETHALLGRLLDDEDAGVRKVAVRVAGTTTSKTLKARVAAIAANDSEGFVRDAAANQ